MSERYEGNYPKTADEWWLLCEQFADQLGRLVARYHPTGGRKHDLRIMAAAAEALAERERKRIRDRSPLEDAPAALREAVERRDAEAASRLLSETWWGIPENSEVRSEPGFFLLCDLCSESGVLHDA